MDRGPRGVDDQDRIRQKKRRGCEPRLKTILLIGSKLALCPGQLSSFNGTQQPRRSIHVQLYTFGRGRQATGFCKMAQAATFGEFSTSEMYTLEQVAAKLNRPREWAYNTLIRPVDHKTKQRLKDAEGNPLHGVFHYRVGSVYLIPGQTLIAWIMEHGERNVE